jgi:hypothetical protein
MDRKRSSTILILVAWGQWSQGGMIMLGDMFNQDQRYAKQSRR